MESKSTSDEIAPLVAEFQRITAEYEEALAALARRHEIVYQLVQTGLTYKRIGQLLGISSARVGQLVQEAAGYVSAKLPEEGLSSQ